MTLAFSTQLNGKPTYFVEKILAGLHSFEDFKGFYLSDLYNHDLDYLEMAAPKLHTIREDKKDRWKPGNKIHNKIWTGKPYNSPTFQFTPVLKCVSTQVISIKHSSEKWRQPWVTVDNSLLTGPEIEELAINDGFESSKEFFEYFNQDFTGKIIHWTKWRY